MRSLYTGEGKSGTVRSSCSFLFRSWRSIRSANQERGAGWLFNSFSRRQPIRRRNVTGKLREISNALGVLCPVEICGFSQRDSGNLARFWQISAIKLLKGLIFILFSLVK